MSEEHNLIVRLEDNVGFYGNPLIYSTLVWTKVAKHQEIVTWGDILFCITNRQSGGKVHQQQIKTRVTTDLDSIVHLVASATQVSLPDQRSFHLPVLLVQGTLSSYIHLNWWVSTCANSACYTHTDAEKSSFVLFLLPGNSSPIIAICQGARVPGF